MADKQAVTELLNHAGVAYDVGDSDFLIGMFSPDDPVFEMTIAGGDPITFEGSEAIAGLFSGAMEEQTDQRRHVVTNLYFENEAADSITAISYLVLITVENGQLTVLSSGVYTDDCVRVGDDWKIQKRSLALDLPY